MVVPRELRSAPCEGVDSDSMLVIPQASKVPLGATVGEDVEEAQELPTNSARGGHCTREEGVGSAMPAGIPVTVALLLFACLDLQEPVWVVVLKLAVGAHARWLPPNSCAMAA